MSRPVVLQSSSGKDSMASLARLRADPEWSVVGLVTSFNEAAGRVAMHGTRMELARLQARALGLPLLEVPLPAECPNEVYEARMAEALRPFLHDGVEHVACGDLFLEDVREYRERQLTGLGFRPIFPIWGTDTRVLAEELVADGWKLILTCVDTEQLDGSFLGRDFDAGLLADLPAGTDTCGENGEFHTFVWSCPLFSQPVAVERGQVVESGDGRFHFIDLIPKAW